VHQKRRKEKVEMKNNGIWYVVGAAVVGLGAWFVFSKKAEAQAPAPPPVPPQNLRPCNNPRSGGAAIPIKVGSADAANTLLAAVRQNTLDPSGAALCFGPNAYFTGASVVTVSDGGVFVYFAFNWCGDGGETERGCAQRSLQVVVDAALVDPWK
jgi:hypothetical protein